MREIVFIALIVLSVPLVLKRPFWGVTIYLGALIIRPEMLFWGTSKGSYFFKVFYILTVVGMLLRNEFRHLNKVLTREFLLMVWLLGAILLSIVFAEYKVHREYYYFFEMLKGFVMCALLYIVVRDFRDLLVVQNVLLGCFAFMALWGIEQQLRGNERLEGLGGSSWGDSNGVAAMFILYLPVALAKLFTSEKKKDFFISLGIVVLMVALVVCTKSRAGLIGVVAAFAAFAWFSRQSARIVQVALVLVLAVVPFATTAYLERMETMKGKENDLAGAARDRITLWTAGLYVFSDNPLFGTGFLTYPEAKMKYEGRFMHLNDDFRAEIFRTESKKVTHNTYIQLLSDCGIVGAVPFVLLVWGGVMRGFRARRFLLEMPEHKKEAIWLAGLGAGVAGFGVCILSIDAALSQELYIQLVLSAMLYRKLRRGLHMEAEPAPAPLVDYPLEGKAA